MSLVKIGPLYIGDDCLICILLRSAAIRPTGSSRVCRRRSESCQRSPKPLRVRMRKQRATLRNSLPIRRTVSMSSQAAAAHVFLCWSCLGAYTEVSPKFRPHPRTIYRKGLACMCRSTTASRSLGTRCCPKLQSSRMCCPTWKLSLTRAAKHRSRNASVRQGLIESQVTIKHLSMGAGLRVGASSMHSMTHAHQPVL